MQILVTGGAGYIGSHTAHQLTDAGHSVTVLDNLYSGFRWAIPAQAEFVSGDVGDRELLRRLLQAKPFDAVLHFAAHVEVAESVADPAKYYRNNTLNSLALIEESIAAGVPKFVFSSTAAVYGEPEGAAAVSEQHRVQPLNPYGASKAMAERILADLAQASGNKMRYVILRYFNAAGARADLKIGQATPRATHLIKVAVEAAVGRREKIVVHGTDYQTPDGTCQRDFVYIEDLADAHIKALTYLDRGGASDVFNVGTGRSKSVLEVIETVKKISGCEFKVEMGPRRAGDAALIMADHAKIQRVLGWRPQSEDLEVICRTAWEWERRLAEGFSAR